MQDRGDLKMTCREEWGKIEVDVYAVKGEITKTKGSECLFPPHCTVYAGVDFCQCFRLIRMDMLLKGQQHSGGQFSPSQLQLFMV